MTNLHIRRASLSDLNKIVEIEAICFPATEAAKASFIEERLRAYSKGFFVAEIDGKIIGFINGACTNGATIKDKYFETMAYHLDRGKHLMIFGLDVLPDYERRGYAAALMEHFIDFAKSEGKDAILLTCKEHLVGYYEKFGYANEGLSESGHGGAKWYDMKLAL